MKFTKMNGLGNDYIFVDTRKEKVKEPEKLAKRLSDRRFSVGGDGLVLIGPGKTSDLSMRIFNADGSEAELCGNALRCVGKYAYERDLYARKEIFVETLAGIKKVVVVTNGENVVTHASVTIGRAQKGFLQYPFEMETVVFGKKYKGYCVSVGNPHYVIFVSQFDSDLSEIGSKIGEKGGIFSCGANVEFVIPQDNGELLVRVIERGSGETYACGTGAAASFFAAREIGLVGDKAEIRLLGGTLSCHRTDENEISVYGAVSENYIGEVKTE